MLNIAQKANDIKDDAKDYVEKNKAEVRDISMKIAIGAVCFAIGYGFCKVRDMDRLAKTLLEASLNA